jgi:hypothetical protein
MSEHIEILTPPAFEPVTLDQAKLYLRVDIPDEDGLIQGLITAARVACEAILRQAIPATTWAWSLDSFPGGGGYYRRGYRDAGLGPGWYPGGDTPLVVPNPPLIAVESIQYRDSGGALVVLPPEAYEVSTGFGSRIQPAPGSAWPVAQAQIDAVTVRFRSGRASAAEVPQPVITAVLMLVAHWFENRDTTVIGPAVNRIPDAVDLLLASVAHGSYV